MSDLFVNEATEHYKNFLDIGHTIQELAKKLGKHIEPVHRKNDPHFLKLSHPDQAAVVERLKVYQDLFELSNSTDMLAPSEKRLLWLALKLLKFMPSSDLMNMVDEEDFIEVYVGTTQVYRSFNYYDICSYSFDELETVPWPELFCRPDASITDDILAEVSVVIQSKKMLVSQTPAHFVNETSSPFQNKILYKLKYIIPIKDLETNRSDCFVAVISASLAKTAPRGERIDRIMEYQNSTIPLHLV